MTFVTLNGLDNHQTQENM